MSLWSIVGHNFSAMPLNAILCLHFWLKSVLLERNDKWMDIKKQYYCVSSNCYLSFAFETTMHILCSPIVLTCTFRFRFNHPLYMVEVKFCFCVRLPIFRKKLVFEQSFRYVPCWRKFFNFNFSTESPQIEPKTKTIVSSELVVAYHVN